MPITVDALRRISQLPATCLRVLRQDLEELQSDCPLPFCQKGLEEEV